MRIFAIAAMMVLASCAPDHRRTAFEMCRNAPPENFQRCVEQTNIELGLISRPIPPQAPPVFVLEPSTATTLSSPPQAPSPSPSLLPDVGQNASGPARPQFIPYDAVSGSMPGIGPGGTPR